MAHMDQGDTKHHEDSNSQATKKAESVKKLLDVINGQMINPFLCEEQALVNIFTGQKTTSEDLVSARKKGLEALATAQETHSDKVVSVKLPTLQRNRRSRSPWQ